MDGDRTEKNVSRNEIKLATSAPIRRILRLGAALEGERERKEEQQRDGTDALSDVADGEDGESRMARRRSGQRPQEKGKGAGKR